MRVNRDLLSKGAPLGLLLVLLHYVLSPLWSQPLGRLSNRHQQQLQRQSLQPHQPQPHPQLPQRTYNPCEALLRRSTHHKQDIEGENAPEDSDYNSNDELRAAFLDEFKGRRFVFFSRITLFDENGDIVRPGSTSARDFALSLEADSSVDGAGAFFRECCPDYYLKQDPVKRSKRANERSLSWYQDFADRFSGVFAEFASGDVYFLYDEPDWMPGDETRVEYPTLTQNTDVDKWAEWAKSWAGPSPGLPVTVSIFVSPYNMMRICSRLNGMPSVKLK